MSNLRECDSCGKIIRRETDRWAEFSVEIQGPWPKRAGQLRRRRPSEDASRREVLGDLCGDCLGRPIEIGALLDKIDPSVARCEAAHPSLRGVVCAHTKALHAEYPGLSHEGVDVEAGEWRAWK